MKTVRSRARALVSLFAIGGALVAASCSGSSDDTNDTELSAKTVTAVHDSLVSDLNDLIAAATAMQAAAPTPSGRGWDPVNHPEDQTAITNMKTAWTQARAAYEHTEGALAPIFPDIDTSIDARYDDFLSTLGPTGDSDLFDDQGVTGLHAVERILYSDSTPAAVVTLESTLPGYKASAFPATEAEAVEFKTKLLGKIISDAQLMKDQWTPAKIDLPGAYAGLVDLMNEQREKVNKAGNQEEESRYSQTTMADLRNNLEGTQKIYGLFRPWLLTKKDSSDEEKDGPTHDKEIEGGFAKLSAIYAMYPGDAFPPAPADWSSESPSDTDLATPFGQLFTAVDKAVDPNIDGSIAEAMNQAGIILGLSK